MFASSSSLFSSTDFHSSNMLSLCSRLAPGVGNGCMVASPLLVLLMLAVRALFPNDLPLAVLVCE